MRSLTVCLLCSLILGACEGPSKTCVKSETKILWIINNGMMQPIFYLECVEWVDDKRAGYEEGFLDN